MNNNEKRRNDRVLDTGRLLYGFAVNKKRFWVILLFIGAALVVLSLVVATGRARSSGSNSGDAFTAKRGDLTITVTEGGSIRARKSVEYKCQVQRRSQTMILTVIPAGTYVTAEDVNKGTVLVQLDPSTLKDELNRQEIQLASDQEDFTSAQAALQIQIKQNESDIAADEMKVRFALMDLQKYLGSELANKMIADINDASNLSQYLAPFIEKVREDPNLLVGSGASQDMKQFMDNIVLSQGNLKTAEATLVGTQKLHDANYVSDLDLERDKLNVVSRRFSSESSAVAKDLFIRYDFPKSAEKGLSDYIEARRALDRTYSQCRSRLAQRQVGLTMAESRLKSQNEQVDELRQQIEYCTIKAKAPGLVVYGTGGSEDRFRAMRGSGVIAVGESVTEGQTIVSMPDTAEMVAEISVHETEVDKVRVGQPASIVMDAFPDKVLQGKVFEVASLPDEQRGWMNPDLKVYKTLVSIDGSHDFLKTRMSCSVKILIEQLKDVIVVPVQVVANRGGKKVCCVSTSSGPVERDVQTGLFNDMFVEVISGLEVGEQVLLNPPLFTEQSSATALLQQPPLPEGQIPPKTNDDRTVAAQGERSGRRAGRQNTGRQGGMGMMMGMGGMDPNQMPAEMRQQMEEFQKLSPEERQKRIEQLRAQMPAEMRQQMEEFQKLSPEERQKRMEQFRNQMPAEMRQRMGQFRNQVPDQNGQRNDNSGI
jgi:HlyD family secretion protein